MIRYSTAALAIVLTTAAAGSAVAQSSIDKPAATNNTSSMGGDKAKNVESAPQSPGAKGPAAAGTVDVSPGVGAIEGADGSPPIPSGGRK